MKYFLILGFLTISCNEGLESKLHDANQELEKCRNDNKNLIDSIYNLKFKNRSNTPKKQRKKKSTNSTIKSKSVESNYFYKSSTSLKTCVTVQCSGKTKKGARCRNMTKNCNGRCYLH